MLFGKSQLFFLVINCLLYCVCSDLKYKPRDFTVMLRHLGAILGKCTWQSVEKTGVVRHSRSYSNWPLEFVSNVSVMNLRDLENTEDFAILNSRNASTTRLRLNNFIMLTSSTDNFQHLITKLKQTVLWDPLAQYLVLDDQTETTGCSNAYAYLSTSWEEDLLYSTYFCLDPEDGFTMYTYNPYTRNAPDSWKEVNPYRYTFRNHVWSLFTQRLIPDRTTCRDFHFDKTITMDDYPVNALMVPTGVNLLVNLSKHGLAKVYGPEGDTIRSALEKLRPHLNLSVAWNTTNYYLFHDAVKNGEYDILLNTQYIFNKPHMVMTYPHDASAIRLLSRFPGYKKQYMRILTYMNPKVIGLVFLVSIITAFVLSTCTGKGLVPSSLEAFRLLLGTAILRSPRRNPLRIYLITVILLFMLTNSVFQSSLSSLLTVAIHKPYINSADDLKKYDDFRLYVFYRYQHVIAEDWMESHIRVIDTFSCVDQVKLEPSAVCAADHTYFASEIVNENFHLSRQKLATLYLAYIVRQNWPLYDRLNYILAVLFQTGIIRQLRQRQFVHVMHMWNQIEREQQAQHVYHVMQLSDLLFVFYILLFGLTLASIVFFVELLTTKKGHSAFRRSTY